MAPGQKRLELLPSAAKESAQLEGDKLLRFPLVRDNATLLLRLVPSAPGNAAGLRQFYLQQMESADSEKRGFVELAQLKSPSFRLLRSLFPLADHNGDGRLTKTELTGFLDLHARLGSSFATVKVTHEPIGLFDLLDGDGNGRLGAAELHSAHRRLAACDRNGDPSPQPTLA